MKRCEKCEVFVYDSEAFCPLCNSYVGKTAPSVVEYPKYENLVSAKSILHSMLWFVAFATLVVCEYISIFTQAKGKTMWPMLVSASCLCCLAMLWLIRTRKKSYGAKVMYSYIFLSAFVVTIDFITDIVLGSTDYVFPLLTLAAIVYLTILSLRSRYLFSEYFGYIMSIITIGLLSIPVYIFVLDQYEWGAFLAILSSIIIALALYLFADKSLKAEVRKRFHR